MEIKDANCNLYPAATQEQVDGFTYFVETLEKIAEKEGHKNCDKAKKALEFLYSMNRYIDRCHLLLHQVQIWGQAASLINEEDDGEVPEVLYERKEAN